MQPNVPVPTDSLYKFSALFGLALIISAVFIGAYVHVNVNDKFYRYVDVYYGPSKRDEADEAKFKKHIEAQVEELKSSTTIAMYGIGGGLGAGIMLCIYGFGRWIKIQPLHDELLELQVAKTRMEVHRANQYRELPEGPKPKKPTKKAK